MSALFLYSPCKADVSSFVCSLFRAYELYLRDCQGVDRPVGAALPPQLENEVLLAQGQIGAARAFQRMQRIPEVLTALGETTHFRAQK